MPKFLIKANYTLDGIRGVAEKGGTARKSAVQAAVKSVGGKLESFYFAFGDTDVYAVCDVPDNTAAAAVAVAVASSGGANPQTVVLITPEEMDAATGQNVKYKPPGS